MGDAINAANDLLKQLGALGLPPWLVFVSFAVIIALAFWFLYPRRDKPNHSSEHGATNNITINVAQPLTPETIARFSNGQTQSANISFRESALDDRSKLIKGSMGPRSTPISKRLQFLASPGDKIEAHILPPETP